MFDFAAWLLTAIILTLIGWGMFAVTRRAAQTRVTEGRGWLAALLALPPAGVYAYAILRFLVEVVIDPTSNNLWPLMVVFLLVAWAGYALALRILLGLAGLLLPPRA